MSSFDEHISGIAGEIRASLDSDQFDLSGYNEIRAKDLIISAFSKPLTIPTKMIRFTFIVGGGKLVRSRYDEDLTKWLTTALREVGYVEDKSAAETFDSQGTYKQQHDTGQNLKYLIVYPHVTCSKQTNNEQASTKTIDVNSPEYIVINCDLSTFKEIVTTKTPSWRQRKRLLKIIQDSYEQFQVIENKLVSGIALTSDEQSTYDSNPGNSSDKITYLQGEIKSLVDNGKLTHSEKQELLLSLDHNLKTIDEEIVQATNENKPNKINKLQEKKQNILTRKSVVDKITPINYRLVHSNEIQKLRVKLIPLLALEERGRSMSLTLADLKTLEEKSEIENKIIELENLSRGWFEDEKDFQIKCDLDIQESKVKAAKLAATKKTSSTSSTSKSNNSSSGWSTIGTNKKSNVNKSTTKKVSSLYAAAFDDDSD